MEKNLHSGHRQRMKQDFLRYGESRFNEHQLVELLLYFAIPQGDTNDLAHRLIERFGSVHGLLQADYEQLTQIKGVGSHAATLIQLCGELVTRYGLTERPVGILLNDTDDIGAFLLPRFWRYNREKFLMVSLNNRHEVINVTQISSGTQNTTAVNNKLILRQAVVDDASEIVLAHNHPAGFPLPSREDVDATLQLHRELIKVDIRLRDHLVISDTDFISMKDTPSLAMIFD